MNPHTEDIWNGEYKIPWDDPTFSRRMLREHLSQDHDLASRRTEWIDRQVDWIHRDLVRGQPSRILDLGCGPGFYSHRLAMLGHRCLGIDFGPASIEHANRNNSDASQCEFVLGDLRHTDFGGPHDLAMMLYGELNVFAPEEAARLLRKACTSLIPGGQLIVEIQTRDAVEQQGQTEASEFTCEAGLFSDKPHRCRTENYWLDDKQTTLQVFAVTETGSESTQTFRSTTKAWSDGDLRSLLLETGFSKASPCPHWPSNTASLTLWLAHRGTD